MSSTKQFYKNVSVMLIALPTFALAAPALTPTQFKDILELKQQYLISSPQVATSITLAEQAFMLECGYPLTKTDIVNIMQSNGFKMMSETVANKSGEVGIFDAKSFLSKELKKYKCIKG
ncbi:hypothetical protein ACXJDW_003201 [Vibrio cholerae]